MALFNPNLLTCNQEEADTGIILHAQDVCRIDLFLEVVVSCFDTDVLLLLVNYLEDLNSCIIFKTSYQVYHFQNIFENLNPNISESLPGPHAFSGFNQTRKFHGFNKRSVEKHWYTTMMTFKSIWPFEELS